MTCYNYSFNIRFWMGVREGKQNKIKEKDFDSMSLAQF